MLARTTIAGLVVLLAGMAGAAPKNPHQSGQCVRRPWRLKSGLCVGFMTIAAEAGVSSCSADGTDTSLSTYFAAVEAMEEGDCKDVVGGMCRRIGAAMKPGVCRPAEAKKETGVCGLLFKQLLGECRGDYNCVASVSRSGIERAQDNLLNSAQSLCAGVDYELLNVILSLQWHDEMQKKRHPHTPPWKSNTAPPPPAPAPPSASPTQPQEDARGTPPPRQQPAPPPAQQPAGASAAPKASPAPPQGGEAQARRATNATAAAVSAPQAAAAAALAGEKGGGAFGTHAGIVAICVVCVALAFFLGRASTSNRKREASRHTL